MSKFRRYIVDGEATRRYSMLEVPRNPDGSYPVIIGKVAGRKNPGFLAALAKANEKKREATKGQKKNAEGLFPGETAESVRKEEVELFVNHCITGWEGILDERDEAIPFSKKDAIELFCELDDSPWLMLRAFFMDSSNFTGGALSEAEAAEVGNESERG